MVKLSGSQKRKVFINTLMAVGTLLVCIITASIALTPQTYDVNQGEISPETITAPEDFVDEYGTERLKQAARDDVGDVYKSDQDLSQQILQKFSDDFAALTAARSNAEQYWQAHQQKLKEESAGAVADAEAAQAAVQKEIDEMERARQAEANAATPAPAAGTEQSAAPTPAPTPSPTPAPTPSPVPIPTAYEIPAFEPRGVDWDGLLTQAEKNALKDSLPSYFEQSDIYTLISMTEEELGDLVSAASGIVQQSVFDGVSAEERQGIIDYTVMDIVQRQRLSIPQEKMLTKIIENDLTENLVFDAAATEELKDKAASFVLPVEYKKGQNIVLKGNVVTEDQYAILKDRGLLASEITAVQPYYAVAIYIAMVFALYITFLAVFNRRLMTDTKKVAILCILTALAYLLTTFAQLLSVNILPMFLFVILGAVLLSPKNAIVYGVFLSLLMMSVTSSGQELLSRQSLILLLTMLLGSFFAVFILKDMRYRSRLLLAGLVAAVPGTVLCFILWLYKITTLQQSFANVGIMLVSGLLCGIVSIGVLPIIESLFKLITPSKLLELSGPNHPLIKRLMMEAPGTYHHSMLVANLAEAGCNAVGGFTLLARVGAYYHDVGKIENPMFFKENQRNNFNPHDNFSPAESAAILRKHVTDGVELLKKHKMPEEIIAIASQHHGNGVAGYFYAKAMQDGGVVKIEDFRYDGIPPKTREGAIVMLADCVEAAVRSMDNPSGEDIEKMVNKLIRERYDEGQLDNAPLNRRDLKQIAQAFINIFQGVYHQRIKYPEIKIHGAEDEDNIL